MLGIVALLAAILFPVFARVRENGRKTVCLSNMRQIMLAVSLYTQDSAGQFPLVCKSPDRNSPNPLTSWTDSLSSYFSTPQLLHCPSDELWTQRQELAVRFGSSPAPSSYVANPRCLTWKHWVSLTPNQLVPRIHLAFERNIVRPSTTVWMCDGVQEAWGQAPYTQKFPYQDGFLVKEQRQSGDVLYDPAGAPTANETCCNNAFAPNDRHLGRANVAFADGHVKVMNNADWYFPGTPWLDPKRGG